ncbi:bacteriophage T4 gp5 trimerisation domain-containing protein [Roseinatronobacter alkalisoli]|uniref:Gp5/Type VI secretion system Vgr C-terminal trimerisation domain-containing protein n=1 Tax=Roseinatronobacter alkalisoli TaxID=3028235 RepID=A0ABT5THG0_9RHOB|nr:hypothetical protein [Roseinatronobacter sp. HJB301]MDD7973801.1 hypothetical protein [Roseinatronobacter sp. HJB301]
MTPKRHACQWKKSLSPVKINARFWGGMEVVVEFLDGDPDQPLVTGCVYNGRSKVPYELRKHKTRSTFRTDTHKGAGFNELRFEDEAGREEIYVHAQKDRNEKILHNHTERIDNNWIKSVGHNSAAEITNNRDEVVGGNVTLSVGAQYIGDIVGSASLTDWQGIPRVAVEYGEKERAPVGAGNMSVRIQGSYSQQTEQNVSNWTGGIWTQYVAKSMSVDVGAHLDVSVKGNHVESAGEKHIIEAEQKLELVCGRARLVMHPDGRVDFSGTTLHTSFNDKILIFTKSMKTVAKGTYTVIADKIGLN